MILTPICTITTSIKPVVLPQFIPVTIKASDDARTPLQLSVDGNQNIKLLKGDKVQIKTSDLPMEFFIVKNIKPLTHWVKKLGKIYHYQNPT